MRKLPYSEGSVFRVPLRDGGSARGVVARAGRQGKVLFGYFFGPRLTSHEAVELNDLHPDDAILRVMFGDLGLINRTWIIHGQVPHWNRAEWPMPDFVMRDTLGFLKPILIRYSDTDPIRVEAEYPIDDDRGMPPDSLSGSGAVEIQLSRLLKPAVGDRN